MKSDFSTILYETLKKILAERDRTDVILRPQDTYSLEELEKLVLTTNIPLSLFFAEASLILAGGNSNPKSLKLRNSIKFQCSKRPAEQLLYTEKSSVKWSLDSEMLRKCVISTNVKTALIHRLTLLYDFDLFNILGMRNLSSFVGELFGKELYSAMKDYFIKNPNQDGYPDLCALTPEGKRFIKSCTGEDGRLRCDKELWSHYPYGGVEIKATCGNTPSASHTKKPLIGESRLSILKTAEWKAHHQETKILLGIFWDFVDGIPTVLAVFFRNDLDTQVGSSNRDWSKIVKPKENGGRTTSVSIMHHGRTENEGVKKMGQGWMVLPKNPEFLPPIAKTFGIALPLRLKS